MTAKRHRPYIERYLAQRRRMVEQSQIDEAVNLAYCRDKRQLELQVEFRTAAAELERRSGPPSQRLGSIQDRIDIFRAAGGLPPQARFANVTFESPAQMLAKAVRSGLQDLARRSRILENNREYTSANYSKRDAISSGIEGRLVAEERDIGQQLAVLQTVATT